jgi:hypothetical protein
VIDTCPECGYSLHGLPTTHACPECGQRYDAECELVQRKQQGAIWFVVAWYVLSGGWFFRLMWRGLPNRGWVLVFKLCCLGIYSIPGYFLLRTIIRNSRRGVMAAVLPGYLLLRLEESRDARIPWSNISRAAANGGVKSVAVFIRDASKIREIRGVFQTREQCEKFAREINRRVAIHEASR